MTTDSIPPEEAVGLPADTVDYSLDITELYFDPVEGGSTLELKGAPASPTQYSNVQNLRIFEVTSPGKHLRVLQSFTGVISLSIQLWDFQNFGSGEVTELFGHFGKTVKMLEICRCKVNSEILISLTSLFPLVDDLWVHPGPDTYGTGRPNLLLDGVKFQGSLVFTNFQEEHKGFLAFVKKNASDVRSIFVHHCVKNEELQGLFNGHHGSKLTSVGVALYHKEGLVSLKSCGELRTLWIKLSSFEWDEPTWSVLDGDNSPNLEEIKIHSFPWVDEGPPEKEWEGIDSILCNFYDQNAKDGVSPFHVSLHPINVHSEGDREQLMEYVRKAWPKFSGKGEETIKFYLEPTGGENKQ